MSYGVLIFDEKGRNLLTLLSPTFVLDYISSPASGSRNYSDTGGRNLKVCVLHYVSIAGIKTAVPATATVSGNTVSWANVSVEQPVIVVAE